MKLSIFKGIFIAAATANLARVQADTNEVERIYECPPAYMKNIDFRGTDWTVSEACIQCPAGEYSQYEDDKYECSKCPSNGFVNEDQTGFICDKGHYEGLLENGCLGNCEMDCIPCSAGTYNDEEGGTCSPCEDGSVSAEGSSQCDKCPANTHSKDNKCECDYGTWDEATNTCKCGVDEYLDEDADQCLSCGNGFTSEAGSTECSCDNGTWQPRADQDQTRCLCDTGYSNTGSDGLAPGECHACPSVAATAEALLPCYDGTTSKSACEECVAEQYDSATATNTATIPFLISKAEFCTQVLKEKENGDGDLDLLYTNCCTDDAITCGGGAKRAKCATELTKLMENADDITPPGQEECAALDWSTTSTRRMLDVINDALNSPSRSLRHGGN